MATSTSILLKEQSTGHCRSPLTYFTDVAVLTMKSSHEGHHRFHHRSVRRQLASVLTHVGNMSPPRSSPYRPSFIVNSFSPLHLRSRCQCRWYYFERNFHGLGGVEQERNGVPSPLNCIKFILAINAHLGFVQLMDQHDDTSTARDQCLKCLVCLEVEVVEAIFQDQFEGPACIVPFEVATLGICPCSTIVCFIDQHQPWLPFTV